MIVDSIRKLGFKPEDIKLMITHHFLEMLKPDIWLAQHNEYYDLEGKRQRSQTDGVSAWIDPEGYRRWVAGKKRAFEDEVDLEMGVPNGK
jgi:metallo-beta-lactamase class B